MTRFRVKLRRVVENVYEFDFDDDIEAARAWINDNRDDFICSGEVETDDSRIVSLKKVKR